MIAWEVGSVPSKPAFRIFCRNQRLLASWNRTENKTESCFDRNQTLNRYRKSLVTVW
ncbi:hypothetical protein BIFADO_02099 [Bifidobacterium adolescentis L2-32]|uniref:Uncharacterized protein n=1 Tax=Bifidobacterium adolescentis L2-32 TaxID=411481 RepID=A7A8A9_BIFAD|nr:hypothetical protein BIFADO_02099 [Bifidobacterium adolescentis L2-32]